MDKADNPLFLFAERQEIMAPRWDMDVKVSLFQWPFHLAFGKVELI